MRVLFIGGTGTLSAACTRLSLDLGMDLYLLVRGTRDHRIPPKAKVIHGDIKKDFSQVKNLLSTHFWDCVVDWVVYDEQDLRRDFELFRDKTRRYIFISSTSVYQKPLPTPRVNETTPIGNPYWEYADKKARCERLCGTLLKSYDFPVVIVRPGASYAEFTLPSGIIGMGYGIVERMKAGKPILLHGDGAGLWSFIFNEDFARAFAPLIALEGIIGEIFQVTSDELFSWIQIYQLIGNMFDCQPSYVFASAHLINCFDPALGASLLGDKSHSYLFDNSKIKRCVPSYLQKIPLSEGLRRCETWYRQHKSQSAISPKYDLLLDRIIDCVLRLESFGNPPQDQRQINEPLARSKL